MADVHLPKHLSVREARNVAAEMVHIKDERYLYPPSTCSNNSHYSVNAVLYEPTRTARNRWQNTKQLRRASREA